MSVESERLDALEQFALEAMEDLRQLKDRVLGRGDDDTLAPVAAGSPSRPSGAGGASVSYMGSSGGSTFSSAAPGTVSDASDNLEGLPLRAAGAAQTTGEGAPIASDADAAKQVTGTAEENHPGDSPFVGEPGAIDTGSRASDTPPDAVK